MSSEEITIKDIMKGKMIADSMLSGLFPALQDVEKTNRTVQSLIHLFIRYPAITKLVSSFMKKIKKDPSYLSQCSSFQKRILLFIVVECVMFGEDIDHRMTAESLTPLETALVRLSDIALSFENEIVQAEFCEIWHQTVKQTVIIFLKNDQPVEASKILVLYRDRIREEQKEMLEKLIEYSSNKKRYIHKLAKMDGHDFTSYYYAMANFIQGLSSKLEETTLHKFATKINFSLSNESETENENSYKESDEENDASDIDKPPEGSQERNKDTNEMEVETEIVHDEIESSSNSTDEQQKIAKTKPLIEIQDSEEESGEDAAANTDNNVDKLDPKIGLTYRLKIHSTGLIIPCKYIASHCREIHNEIEEDENQRPPSSKSKSKSHKPLTATNLSSFPYKAKIPPRNLLLGERFEDLNSTFQSSVSSRTYGSRTRIPFTIDLDSYIVVGCRHFGVGQWSKILKAFPFPPSCTNVKIKDRFRNLIKLQHIAMLDDGDFNVMNNELKSRLPSAEAKMKKDGKFSTKRKNRWADSSVQDSSPSISGRKKNEPIIKEREKPKLPMKKKTPKHNETQDIRKKTTHRHKDILQEEMGVMSLGSSEENHVPVPASSTPLKKSIKFTQREDAYLLCGARHLGMRWNVMKEYFDFNPNITTIDMQNRWDRLLDSGKIYVNEDDDEIVCQDENLLRRCEAVTNELKKRIQNQRKKFVADEESNHSLHSSEEDEGSSIPAQNKPSTSRHRRIESSCSSIEKVVSEEDVQGEIEDDVHFQQPAPIKVRPKARKIAPKLNTSTDAGTQTRRPKIALRRKSPSLLEASSSSSSDSSSRSPSPDIKEKKRKNPMGSPIRPSTINSFKQPQKIFDKTSKKRKRDRRRDSYAIEMREKRQREISRLQRQNVVSKKNPWKDAEIKELLSGLEKHGPGKWSTILDEGYDVFNNRTSVMLKDKFRNMLRHNAIPEDLVLLWNARKAAKE